LVFAGLVDFGGIIGLVIKAQRLTMHIGNGVQ
jgi:hypothetical protein